MKLYLLLAAGLILSGCATVTRGAEEAWTVQTDPAGARVKTSTGFACDQTPCTFRMPRKSDFDVTITKEGYVILQTHVTHHTSNGGAAGMAGNVLAGGLIGIGVDATSGATEDITPNPLIVKLEKTQQQVATAAPAAPAQARPQLQAAQPQTGVCAIRVPATPTAIGDGVVLRYITPDEIKANIQATEASSQGAIDPDYLSRDTVAVQLDNGQRVFGRTRPFLSVQVGDRVSIEGWHRNPALPCNYIPNVVSANLTAKQAAR